MPLKQKIYIDNNVWDFFFQKKLCMCHYLPSDRYSLHVNKEVDFESEAIPKNKPGKEGLPHFIENCRKCCVTLRQFFGFYNPKYSPDRQRQGGFGQGTFADVFEEEFRKALNEKYLKSDRTRPSTGLHPNEADIDLAIRSTQPNTIVMTADKKPGPLNPPAELVSEFNRRMCDSNHNYQAELKVVFLNNFNIECDELEGYILRQLEAKRQTANEAN